MELFVLSEELKKQGFSLSRKQSKALNEVIVFNDGNLYSSNAPYNEYLRKVNHKRFIRDIRKGVVSDPFRPADYRLIGLRAEEVVKTHYEWELDIIIATRFQTITEVLNPEISFYRLDHEDAKPRIQIHSLWLAIPTVVTKLEHYLIPEKGTTTLQRRGAEVIEDQQISGGSTFIGDDNLSLMWVGKDSKNPNGWKKYK